jgi:hypothetical protein
VTRRAATFRDPTERAANGELFLTQLEAVLQTLNEREQGVIRLRFGLSDEQPRTLDEIGTVFGVTGERARQLLEKALTKLRHSSRSDILWWLREEDWGNLERMRARVYGGRAPREHYEPLYCHRHGLAEWVVADERPRPGTACPQCDCYIYHWTGGRPQSYYSNACRQAAYRQRKRAAKPRRRRTT